MNEHSDFPKNINHPLGYTPMPSMLDHAIDYARDFNWPVFPCDPKTKRPLTENGFKDASLDPEQISAWWHRWPSAMIGMRTGGVSHIVVLDVDVDPDKGIDGRQSLSGLEIPATMAVRTPRGGIHYYFDWPDGTEIRNSAGQIGPGLDVRGEGGYVIVPPSVNAAGKAYEWATGEGPVKVPDWFLEKTKKEERSPNYLPGAIDDARITAWGEAALAAICDDIALAPEGRRHDALIRGSARMFNIVAGGYSNASHVCNQIWQAAKIAGLPAKEIDDALKWGQDMAQPAGPTERSGPTSRSKEEPKPNGETQEEVKPEPFSGIDAASLNGQQKPREYIDAADIFPARNVSLLGGDGDVGKSRLAIQLALACTTETQWMGVDVLQCPVVYFSAEDDQDEITNRLNEICDKEGIDLAGAKGLTILDMVGEDTVLGEAVKEGRLKPTPQYHRLYATLERYQPGLLILDNLADVFAGNENNRGHAKQFVTLMRKLGRTFNCHVCMLGHPSMSGRDKGTGESGSTAWNNSVRCRLYLHKPADADADAKVRILEVMKANYKQEPLRWELQMTEGRLVRTEIKNAFDRITVDDVDRVKELFAKGGWRVNEQSVDWGGYAVADLLDWDVGRGIGSKQRSAEQNRNRANIRTYLGTWVRTKAIFVIEGLTQRRERTQFYSDKAGLSLVRQ